MTPVSISTTARGALGAAFLLVFGSSLWVIGHYGTLMPYFDQWVAEGVLLFKPWLLGTLTWGDMLRAFNEHHVFTARALALLLFKLNHGVWNIELQEAVNAAVHAATLTLLLAALLPACPPRWRGLFVPASVLMLLVPVGWENLLCSFQTQIYGMMFFSLLLVTRLARAAPLTRGWWLALPWGLLAYFSQAPAVVALALGALIALSWLRLPGVHGERRGRALLAAALLLAAAVAGFALTPMPDTVLRHSYHDAPLLMRLSAFLETLSWPLFPGCFVIVWLPFARFAVPRLRQPPGDDAGWMVLCVGLWVVAQCAGIAYGRGPVPMAPRYQDILVMGLPVGLVCLLRWLDAAPPSPWRERAALAWGMAITLGMILQLNAALIDLDMRHTQGLGQQAWIARYLAADATGRRAMAASEPKTYPDIASPLPFLQEPVLVPILPGAVPAATARQAGWVTAFTGALEPLGLGLTLLGGMWLLRGLLRERGALRPD